MQSKSLLLPLTMSLCLINATVWAEVEQTTVIASNATAEQSAIEEDEVTAKLAPIATAFLIDVGVPIASSLFKKILNKFSKNSEQQTQATQNIPLFSPESKTGLKKYCYAYIDYKVKVDKTKYNDLANQFGGLCEILAPTAQKVQRLNFPEPNPQYSESQAQTTQPLDVKILQGYGVNYQGLQIQIEMLDKQNNVIETRPAQASFKSGERFRLKVTPTFTGFLQVKNIESDGKTIVLFPKAPIQFVQLNAGETMILPANPRGFYEFDTQKGTEQLVVQFADYQGFQGQFSKQMIYRYDQDNSTYLMQEVKDKQYPAIVHAISIQHQ